MNGSAIRWPAGKKFAFTIMDDTDRARWRAIKPFYDALVEYGLRTTRTAWVFDSPPGDSFAADTLQDRDYRAWMLELRDAGFEVAWHGARSGGTVESVHRQAFERFFEIFGSSPRTYANHAVNPECLYWGEERFDDPLLRAGFRRFSGRGKFFGSTSGTQYHWEDLCAEKLHYVRGFNFDDVVTSARDPWMPYHDPRRPAVARWFSASDGSSVEQFVRLLQSQQLDLLERQGGCCIVYAHIADGFVRDGVVETRVRRILDDLAARNGWYAPVAAILDHIERSRGGHVITTRQHRRLEWRWAAYQLRRRLRTFTSL